jgi:hypothetical protein
MSALNEREAMLRRALHAAADAIEPRADGLEHIRARLRRPRPLALAWAEAAWTDVRLRAPAGLDSWRERLLSVIGLAWDRFGPRRGMSGHRGARSLGWLRPLAALSVTVFIVAAGVYVAIDAQQAIFPSSSKVPPNNGGGAGSGGASASTNAGTPSTLGVGSSRGTTKSASCRRARPASSASPSPSQSIPQTQSPSATPTPTPSDSSTGTPSPSPSVTDSSSAPATGDTAPAGQATSEAITATSQSPAAVVEHAGGYHSVTARPTPSPCAKKPVKRNPSGPSAHPGASTSAAAITFGRLNEGDDSASLV